jgi:hypothetical protein
VAQIFDSQCQMIIQHRHISLATWVLKRDGVSQFDAFYTIQLHCDFRGYGECRRSWAYQCRRMGATPLKASEPCLLIAAALRTNEKIAIALAVTAATLVDFMPNGRPQRMNSVGCGRRGEPVKIPIIHKSHHAKCPLGRPSLYHKPTRCL